MRGTVCLGGERGSLHRMVWKWSSRTGLVLALTVYPLTEICCQPVSDSYKAVRPSRSRGKQRASGHAGWDKSTLRIFDNMPWSAVKMLMGLMDSVQDGLDWFASCMPPGMNEVDTKHMRTGKEILDRLNEEHGKLEKEVSLLKGELQATRDNLVALTLENKGLEHKLATSREAVLILEQDRKQLQALLEDKCRLQEENARLKREIGALQELLEYAAEHVVEELGTQALEEDVKMDFRPQYGEDPPPSLSDLRTGF